MTRKAHVGVVGGGGGAVAAEGGVAGEAVADEGVGVVHHLAAAKARPEGSRIDRQLENNIQLRKPESFTQNNAILTRPHHHRR